MSLYGGSEHKLSDLLQIPLIEARKILNNYWSVIPGVKKFLNMIAVTAVAKGQIRTDQYYKRIRWFPNLVVNDPASIESIKREARNVPPQGTNANLMKQILIGLQEEIDTNSHPAKLLLVVHDEVVTEVSEEFGEEWKEIQERIMIETIKIIIKTIPVEVTTGIAKHWIK